MNVDRHKWKEFRKEETAPEKNSSGLFPLTGNCVFDLSHHTHLVIACEVSLFPRVETRKFAITAVTHREYWTLKSLKDEKRDSKFD